MVHGLPFAIEIRGGDDRYDLEAALLGRWKPGRWQFQALPAVRMGRYGFMPLLAGLSCGLQVHRRRK